jgi:tripartite-type tricarboxylate transporter receptor subunit TctC
VRRLNAELLRLLREPEVLQKMAQIGAEPKPGTPEEFAAMLHGEIEKWAGVVRAADIRMN